MVIYGETTVEQSETFLLTLSNTANATMGIDQATGMINNDDM